MHLHMLEQIANPGFSVLLESLFLKWQVQNTPDMIMAEAISHAPKFDNDEVYKPTYHIQINTTENLLCCTVLPLYLRYFGHSITFNCPQCLKV